MTNYEKIKNMSVEDMATLLWEHCRDRQSCYNCFFDRNECYRWREGQKPWQEWLESETEEKDNETI